MISPEKKFEILEGAEEAFFVAMMDGYAGEKKNSIKTTDSDGYKTITWEVGNYKVVDRYCVTPKSDFSAGTTTIFYRYNQWIPVWWMSYGGYYPGPLIYFLKKCLKTNYEKKVFMGGRGPSCVKGETGESYINKATGDFDCFSGEEQINSDIAICKGYHKYFGMALI
jgi:hypothetical protein